MEIKRKTEILVETSRRFVIHQSDSPDQITCAWCNGPMLTAEQAATILGISRRAVYQLVETGGPHFTEIETGAVMICLSSLATDLDERTRLLPEAVADPLPEGNPEHIEEK